ncbi:MAG TPA: SCO family protein [Fimbriimonadaceae bacterium]|jgi:protein SCO1/2
MKLVSRFAVPVIVLILVGLSVAFAVSLKNAQGGDVSKKMGLDQKLGNKLPLDAKFKDEDGKDVRLGDYFGKRPVLLMLVFYSCQGACQLEFENATQTFVDMKNKNIAKDYDVVSISINPKETPELAHGKRAEILDRTKLPGGYDGWHFLTGSQAEVQKVAKAIGYRYSYDPAKNQILHPTGLFVITPDGHISRYLYGVDYVATMVSDSIDTAAKGKINVPSDPILFGCIQYDPNTGKTRVNVFRALQVGGFLTIFTVAGLIFMLSRTNPNQPDNTDKEVDLGPGV